MGRKTIREKEKKKKEESLGEALNEIIGHSSF